jgi:hypothetical protein
MAHPPVPSVVVKTPRMTPAQAVQAARAAQAKFNAGLPNPLALPNLTNVSPTGATVGSASRPIHTNRRGLVTNPANDPIAAAAARAKPLPNAPAKAPKVKVQVHPDGTISVTAHGHTQTSTPQPYSRVAAPSSPAGPAAALGAAPKGGKYQTDAKGRTDTTLNRNPRVPAVAGVAAPQLSIEQQAQNLLNPVEKSITDAINARVNSSQDAITGYAKDLAQMMGQYGPEAKAAYGNAETGQAAIDAALAQTLSGAGTSGQADLAGKLAAIDADPGTAARIMGTAGTDASGALGAAAGRGASSLSQLVGEKANAQDFGATQPGLAGLYGLQATKANQAKGVTDTASAVAQLEQQFPGIVQTLKTDTNQNKQLRFEHGVALLNANGGVVTPEIKTLLGGALPVGLTPKAKAAAAAAGPKVDSTLSKAYGVQTDQQGRAIVGKDGKPIPYPTGGGTTPKVNVSLSKIYGILVDNTGSPILHRGKPVELPPDAKAASGGKYHGLTASKYQTEQAKAAGLARIAHEPTSDGHPGVSWQQYLTGTLKQGVPWWIAIQEGKRVYSPAEIKLGLIPGQGK